MALSPDTDRTNFMLGETPTQHAKYPETRSKYIRQFGQVHVLDGLEFRLRYATNQPPPTSPLVKLEYAK